MLIFINTNRGQQTPFLQRCFYNPLMPKTCSIALFLYILFILTQNCETQIDTMGCTFFVTSNDTKCQALLLKRCQWDICTAFATFNNITSCIRHETITKISWGQCMDHCCPNSGPSTYGTLQECIDQKNKQMAIIGMVFGGIAGFIIFLVILSCLAKKFTQQYGTFRNFIAQCCKKTARVEPMIVISLPSQLSKTEVNSSMQFVEKWSEQSKDMRNQDEQCSICLNNSPNAQLQCKHFYHHSCIGNWFNRNNCCPNCKGKIKNITIYCSKCWKSKKTLYLLSHKSWENIMICGNCTQQKY